MQMQITRKGAFQVIRVREHLVARSRDIPELTNVVADQLKRGTRDIAISLSERTLLSTYTGATLVTCWKLIRRAGGRLAIVHPNKEFHEYLEVTDFDSSVSSYSSEDDLPK